MAGGPGPRRLDSCWLAPGVLLGGPGSGAEGHCVPLAVV